MCTAIMYTAIMYTAIMYTAIMYTAIMYTAILFTAPAQTAVWHSTDKVYYYLQEALRYLRPRQRTEPLQYVLFLK